MIRKIDLEIIPAFLLSPKLRLYRHLSLILIVACIAFSFVLFISHNDIEPRHRYIGWFLFVFVFTSSIYLNIYVLTPYLLFKNKSSLYFVCLLLTIIVVIILIVTIQKNIIHSYSGTIGKFTFYHVVLNVASSIVTFLLLFMGTTALLIFKYWIGYMQRVDELEAATLESELKLLKNQINPHFLFNMLNNANVLIKKKRAEAANVLFKLEDLLRYQINDSSKDTVLLSSDIHFLNDFLNLEKIRRDKFDFSISKQGSIEQIQIPPLLFISFVENAIKHNPDSENMSYVHLSFNVKKNKLEFCCINSKPDVMATKNDVGGLGLKNIKRRLELLYPNRHALEIKNEEKKYTVNLLLNL